jgi:putative transposase
MSHAVSLSTRKSYGVVMVINEWDLSRSSYYARREREQKPASEARKRGPRTKYTDEELTEHIRQVLIESPFVGEGHRKAWAQLRVKGVRTSKARVLRLMREAGLLAPGRPSRTLGPRSHEGTITTERPNEMWGTDLTTTVSSGEGTAAVFVAVDHCNSECVGIHAAKEATRFEALEPIRQAVREYIGGYDHEVALGLKVRHDHGSQYVSGHFQDELRFLGIESSPAFVRAPEGNGVAERFIRTLKEQFLWVRSFQTIEELRLTLQEFRRTYNERWLVERHGHRTPAEIRRRLAADTQEAA